MLNNLKKNLIIQKSTVFIVLFLTGLVVKYLLNNLSFELEHVKDNLIGIATIKAVDVGKRISYFYIYTFIALGLFYIISFLINRLTGKFHVAYYHKYLD